MLKDIISVDPLFGFTTDQHTFNTGISGQVCYQLIKKIAS